jgi:two-component system sensor histidine kinase DctS
VQALEALQSRTLGHAPLWAADATELLRAQRELLRIERRDLGLERPLSHVDTPHRPPLFDRLGRASAQADVTLACTKARRASAPAYSTSYFVPQADGPGPAGDGVVHAPAARLPVHRSGFLVATYSLNEILTEMVGGNWRAARMSLSPTRTARDWPSMAMPGVARAIVHGQPPAGPAG